VSARPVVWTVLRPTVGGTWTRPELALLAAGQALTETVRATGAEASFEVVLLGSDGSPSHMPQADCVHVLELDRDALDRAPPAAVAGALASHARSAGVRYLMLDQNHRTFELLAPLAVALDGSALSDLVGFALADGELRWRRPCFGGRWEAELRVRGQRPLVLGVRASAFLGREPTWASNASASDAPASDAPRMLVQSLDLATMDRGRTDREGPPHREWLSLIEPEPGAIDLSLATRIVAVGRGLGDPAKLPPILRLTEALGAELAGSRPVIDAGWLPPERQVGSSGQTVAPRLYLALGISGAAQHLAGMSGSHCVVAINDDPAAPIFRWSRYGIVGDLHELVPALTRAIESARER
jgi:electron transfer flavoprotein alpha subunit